MYYNTNPPTMLVSVIIINSKRHTIKFEIVFFRRRLLLLLLLTDVQ